MIVTSKFPFLAEPVQQSLNVGIRCRCPGIKFNFAQRAVIIQEERNLFSGRESPFELLPRLSDIDLEIRGTCPAAAPTVKRPGSVSFQTLR
jgi:hypothetical protein